MSGLRRTRARAGLSALLVASLFACEARAQEAAHEAEHEVEPDIIVLPTPRSTPRGTQPAITPPPASAPVGKCLGGSCVGQPVPFSLRPESTPGGCGISRVAAYTGLVATAGTLGAGVALGLTDHGASYRGNHDRIAWGVYTGGVALFTPAVALGSYIARRRCNVEGHPAMRWLGWTAYSGSLSVAAFSLWVTWHGTSPTLPLSIGIAASAMFGLLPHAFDAYMTSRQARGPALSVQLGPVSTLKITF